MELFFNLLLAIFLIVFYIESTKFGEMTISTDKLGAKGFPQMIIIVSLILLAYITYKYLKNRSKENKKAELDVKGLKVMISTIILFAAYIFSMSYIGFIVSTLAFCIITISLLGYKDRIKNIIFSVAVTLSITLIFGKLFLVALPRGVSFFRELSYFIY